MIPEIDVKMNSRIIMKNHAADQEISFLTKSISKPYGRRTAMSPAWELRVFFGNLRGSANFKLGFFF